MIKYKKGITNAVIIIAAIILAYIFVYSKINLYEMLNVLKNVTLGYIVTALLCMVVFGLCEANNISRMLKITYERSSFLNCLKYAATGFFFSSVTPSASGGQPMQILAMRKDGHDTGKSVMALLMHSSGQLMASVSYGLIGFIYMMHNDVFTPPVFKVMFFLGLLINFIVLTVFLMGMFATDKLKWVSFKTFIVLKKLRIKKANDMELSFESKLIDYTKTSNHIKANKKEMAKIQITALIQLGAYNIIPCFVCMSMHLQDILIPVLLMQSMLNVSVSMVPIPGTLGANEGLFNLIYTGIVGAALVGPVMILVRLINYYIPVLFTGLISIINVKETPNIP